MISLGATRYVRQAPVRSWWYRSGTENIRLSWRPRRLGPELRVVPVHHGGDGEASNHCIARIYWCVAGFLYHLALRVLMRFRAFSGVFWMSVVQCTPNFLLCTTGAMATIRPRKKVDGSVSYTAQIRIKQQGTIVYQEAQTFARKQAAQAWVRRVASVSGHRDWNSLRRYTHLRGRGDPYIGWSWLQPIILAPVKLGARMEK